MRISDSHYITCSSKELAAGMAAILPPHDAEGHLRMAKETDDSKENDGEETEIGLDMSQTAVKKMIAEARARKLLEQKIAAASAPPG